MGICGAIIFEPSPSPLSAIMKVFHRCENFCGNLVETDGTQR
jgi:hypothetical protein